MTDLLDCSTGMNFSESNITSQSTVSFISEKWFDFPDTEYETCKYIITDFEARLTDFLNQKRN